MDENPTTTKAPPSLRDFDYFADVVASGGKDELSESAEERRLSLRRNRRRMATTCISSSLFLLVSLWFLWSYRDLMQYAFASPRPPQVLGDVVEMTPSAIPHNAYVSISGVTEHRGLTQKLVRGLVPVRDEYWFFRLVGSRGVFIEVEPDSEHYGFATRVQVSGRAVDPAQSQLYQELLAKYRDRFTAAGQTDARIIQVGVEPGQGRAPFIVAFGIVAVILVLDLMALSRYWRARRAHKNTAGAGSSPATSHGPPVVAA